MRCNPYGVTKQNSAPTQLNEIFQDCDPNGLRSSSWVVFCFCCPQGLYRVKQKIRAYDCSRQTYPSKHPRDCHIQIHPHQVETYSNQRTDCTIKKGKLQNSGMLRSIHFAFNRISCIYIEIERCGRGELLFS